MQSNLFLFLVFGAAIFGGLYALLNALKFARGGSLSPGDRIETYDGNGIGGLDWSDWGDWGGGDGGCDN